MAQALRATKIEAEVLEDAMDGPITESVTFWLAAQYAAESRKRLTQVEGEERFKLLRMLMADWAKLRRGDHLAEQLEIRREGLEIQRVGLVNQREALRIGSQDAEMRWRHKISVGLDVLYRQASKHPEANRLLQRIMEILRPRVDPTDFPVSPTESDSIPPKNENEER